MLTFNDCVIFNNDGGFTFENHEKVLEALEQAGSEECEAGHLVGLLRMNGGGDREVTVENILAALQSGRSFPANHEVLAKGLYNAWSTSPKEDGLNFFELLAVLVILGSGTAMIWAWFGSG